MTTPKKIRAGDTVEWQLYVPEYPYEAGWSLSYALRGPAQINLAADPDFTVHIAARSSASYAPGIYSYVARVSNAAGDVHTVDVGSLTIEPDIASTDTFYDTRSIVKKTLDAVEAVLLKRATDDQLKYTIQGRSLERTPLADLMRLRDIYKAEFDREQAAAGITIGVFNTGNKLRVRFR
jgi:hypothetical protein